MKAVLFPFPTRISVPKTIGFAAALVCVEQLQGTGLSFSVMVFAFIVLSVVTFNAARGFEKATGIYVFAYSLLTVIVGVVWKSVLREPADSNLHAATTTIGAYVASMVAMLGAVLVSRSILAGKRSFSERFSQGMDYDRAATGCLVAALLIVAGNLSGIGALHQILSGINQLNLFFPLAVILGTRAVIVSSGGRRSISWTTGMAMLISAFLGFVSFSKQGLLTPPVSWLFAAASMRFRFRAVHVIVGGVMTAIIFGWLTPVIQLGKNYDSVVDTFSDQVALASYLLMNPDVVRAQTLATTPEPGQERIFGYYNTPQGLMERFTILPTDDELIAYTDLSPSHQFGLGPIRWAFENMLPHVLLPNKEDDMVGGGNFYVHEMGGGLTEDDHTTGISFSPAGEAFHLASWLGVLLLAPAVWILLFTTVDFLWGETRSGPWALMVGVAYLHVAPEGLLGNTIYFVEFGNLGVLAAMIFCTRLAPILGALFQGQQRMFAAAVPVRRPRIAPLVSPAATVRSPV